MYISMCIFIMDIIIKFKTGYYYLGEVIYNGDKIFKQYIKNEFLYNVISLSFLFLNYEIEVNHYFTIR